MTPAGTRQQELEGLRERVPQMGEDELRIELANIASEAQTAGSSLATPDTRVMPSSTPPSADLLLEPDLRIQQAKQHNLHRLIQYLNAISGTSGGDTGRNIGRMFREMNITPANIEWHINLRARGLVAAMTYRGVRGFPPSANIRITIGNRGYLYLQNPDLRFIIPTMYHELYHAYEFFSLHAKPNFSREEMRSFIQQLQSGTNPQYASDVTAHGSSAIGYAFYVESEMIAELMAHSSLQDPSIGGTSSPRTVNLLPRSEEEVRLRLRELRMFYGLATARQIAEQLLRRADNEPWLHATTRRRFREIVDMEIPPIRSTSTRPTEMQTVRNL